MKELYSNKSSNARAKALKRGSTYNTCKPHARCKQIHKCKTCHDIHAVKQLNKRLNHITDKKLKKYKYAKYITITSKNLVDNFDFYNMEIDSFNDYLTNGSKRKARKHPFYNSEYISFKEITRSEGNKELFPHLHIILLTNKDNLLFDNPYFDYDIRDIKIELDDRYKEYNDYNNPLTTTLKKIYKYSTKADKNRLSFERVFDISKGKNDVRASKLFKFTPLKSHKIIPIHIKRKSNILKMCREARREALKQHTEYKSKHKRAKDITIHRHALKTKKQIHKIEATKKELLQRLEHKLKPRRGRPRLTQT